MECVKQDMQLQSRKMEELKNNLEAAEKKLEEVKEKIHQVEEIAGPVKVTIILYSDFDLFHLCVQVNEVKKRCRRRKELAVA